MALSVEPYAEIARRGPGVERAVPPGLKKVRNIIAVGSGKGGVGKSTVTCHLAVALARRGARVALLDADIYGPSQPLMMGLAGRRMETATDVITPPEVHGVGMLSIGLLVPADGPVVWRAPMAVQMLQQFLSNVDWGDRDYLLIDMPPGTGDVQLTLAQQAALTGAVVVTTPQDAALGIARKGLKMFQQVKVPILGVVENMAGYACVKCGEVNDLFKKGGGERLAAEAGAPFLGAIPLDRALVEAGDGGVPVVASAPESPSARAFFAVTEALERAVAQAHGAGGEEPQKIGLSAQGGLELLWPDGRHSSFKAYDLRIHCPCAACVDERTGKPILDIKRVPLDVRVQSVHRVGRYGLSPHFSDGHSTGIYTLDRLKAMEQQAGPSAFSV